MLTPADPVVPPIQHAGEEASNAIRRLVAQFEPACLRTYTPSLAVLAKSAGCYHWTPEGRKLADFSSGVLVANLGHNPKRWWRRVLDYLGVSNLAQGSDKNKKRDAPSIEDGVESTGGFFSAVPLTAYNAVTELDARASERLVMLLNGQPGGGRCEQVLWAASGSEAIQKALWAALDRRPGADVMLSTRHGFHGKKGLAGAVTGSEQDKERDARVRFLSFPTAECANLDRRRQPLDIAPYKAELAALKTEFGDRICCLITEPYLGGGGSYHPQKEYLQLLQRFCRENDIVFILDEVQSNFGRTGKMFAFVDYGLEPDIVILGKGLGNGVPVSAAVGRADLFAAMHYGECSDTWSANPLSSAAVLATLDEFETEDILGHAAKLSEVIENGLRKLAKLDVVENVRGEGTVWGVECAAVGKQSASDVANACVLACYYGDHKGRAIHLLGPLANKVLRVSPPLVMPLDEAKEYFEVMHGMFQNVQTACRRV